MNIDMKVWPVLMISLQFDAPNDEELRLRALMGHLQEEKGLSVQSSFSYEDGFLGFHVSVRTWCHSYRLGYELRTGQYRGDDARRVAGTVAGT